MLLAMVVLAVGIQPGLHAFENILKVKLPGLGLHVVGGGKSA